MQGDAVSVESEEGHDYLYVAEHGRFGVWVGKSRVKTWKRRKRGNDNWYVRCDFMPDTHVVTRLLLDLAESLKHIVYTNEYIIESCYVICMLQPRIPSHPITRKLMPCPHL